VDDVDDIVPLVTQDDVVGTVQQVTNVYYDFFNGSSIDYWEYRVGSDGDIEPVTLTVQQYAWAPEGLSLRCCGTQHLFLTSHFTSEQAWATSVCRPVKRLRTL